MLAELCGVHHQLVGQVRSQLDDSSSSTTTRLGRDGKRRRNRAKPGARSPSASPEKLATQETADLAPALIPEEGPAVTGSAPGMVPATADDEEGAGGRAAIRSPLADGSEVSSSVLTEGWIEPGWVFAKLGNTKTHAQVERPAQQQGCARAQRILIGLADTLNRQLGSAPSSEDLHHVDNALTELRSFTLAHRDY